MDDRLQNPSDELRALHEELEREKIRAEIARLRAPPQARRRHGVISKTLLSVIPLLVALVGLTDKWIEARSNRIRGDTAVQGVEKERDKFQEATKTLSAQLAIAEAKLASSPGSNNVQPLSAEVTSAKAAQIQKAALPASSKPRLYVYFANSNQVGRLNADVYQLFSKDFEVVEMRQLDVSNRPSITEVLFFTETDRSIAAKIQGILIMQFKVGRCEVMRDNDPKAARVPPGRRPGEFVVWFDRSVGSPAKSLIRLFGG
jgi:hypothetical protein